MYQRRLRANNSLDFDDLIMATIQLFKEVPEVLDFTKRNSSTFTSMSTRIRTVHSTCYAACWLTAITASVSWGQ